MPFKATPGSACYDIYSIDDGYLYHSKDFVFGTGLSVEVPKGYMLEIRPRSGLASHGVILSNSPATIDSDYRGEIRILITKVTNGSYEIKKGDRIAQIRLVELVPTEFEEVEELSKTERGEGGLGSTGR